MTIYNSTNNISEDYTFIINIDEILYTEQELINLELDIYQCDDPELDELVWHTTNNITSIYNTLKEDNNLSSIGLLDTDIDCKDIFSAIINNEVSTHTYIGLQNNDRTNLPTFDENQYFILLAKEEDNLFLCIPIKHYGLYNNIRIVDINTFEPADFEYLSAKQVQNLIYSLISKMEILEFVDTLPPKASARTNLIYLLTEIPSDPTDLVDDGLNLNFGLYIYSKTLNDYKKLDTLTFDIKQFAKKNHTHAIGDVTDLQTTLDSKASSTDLSNGLQNIGAYTVHTVYSVSGTTSAYDISSGLLYAQLKPAFFLVKNTIGDNEANATLKYYPNGNNITIINTSSNTSNSPIQQGAWKKDTWGLFFCVGNNIVQLRCVFYDSVDIDKIKNILGTEDLRCYIVSSVSKDSKKVIYTVESTAISDGNSFYLKVPYYETSTDVRVVIRSNYPIKQGSNYVTESQVNGHLLKLRYNGGIFEVLEIYDDKLVPFFSDLSTVATTGSYNDLSNKPTIPIVPTNVSAFTNDSGYITSSSVPNPSSTTPSADTTSGSVGTGTTWARSNHTHPKSSLYAEASHTHSEYVNPTIVDNLTSTSSTSVLSAKQGKVLNDLIGDAITYINGTGGS